MIDRCTKSPSTMKSKLQFIDLHSSQVSYITAFDVWMGMSLAFVILALLETVLVARMYQKEEQSEASVS